MKIKDPKELNLRREIDKLITQRSDYYVDSSFKTIPKFIINKRIELDRRINELSNELDSLLKLSII